MPSSIGGTFVSVAIWFLALYVGANVVMLCETIAFWWQA